MPADRRLPLKHNQATADDLRGWVFSAWEGASVMEDVGNGAGILSPPRSGSYEAHLATLNLFISTSRHILLQRLQGKSQGPCLQEHSHCPQTGVGKALTTGRWLLASKVHFTQVHTLGKNPAWLQQGSPSKELEHKIILLLATCAFLRLTGWFSRSSPFGGGRTVVLQHESMNAAVLGRILSPWVFASVPGYIFV